AAAVWVTAGVLAGAYVSARGAALLLPVAGPILAAVVAFAGVSGYRQLTEASSRRWITRVFEQYTSPAHVEEIIGNPDALRLGGERRQITVLFSDVADFTPLSERMAPEKLVALLQHYLGTMTAILYAERATLDKYEGDGIMAFVGAPVQVPDHALRAVRAALAMQNALPDINHNLVGMGLLEDGSGLRIRIGCSSGPANVGNFGSETRFDYTAMGDTVNLGGRLEEANRWLGTKILVPESTRRACGEAVLFREVGLARIRGKAEPVRLFEPLALEPAPDDLRSVAEVFGRAVQGLEQSAIPAAEAALADLLAAHPDDAPARALARRIRAVRDGEVQAGDPWNLARPKEDTPFPDAH
ncbi:MAG: adenylate/guanylate cyclase domain-containing protein, partial [Planctomycetota bacterium]|nr:adenylate/guanylate cyclase domain-containing protein [Planctomycetota bacterium]